MLLASLKVIAKICLGGRP